MNKTNVLSSGSSGTIYRGWIRSALFLATAGVVLGVGQYVWAAEGPATQAVAADEDGGVYPVEKFTLTYMFERQGVPSIEQLGQTEIVLGRQGTGLVKWREGLEKATFRLSDVSGLGTDKFHLSALKAIAEQVTASLHENGVGGTYVGIDNACIQASNLEDRRSEGDKGMKMLVFVGKVSEVRTVAEGERFKMGDRVNNPANERVKEESPIQTADGKNLIYTKELDSYLNKLNRSSWRKVDASLAAGERDGEVTLDYRIAESKPWSAYVQLSNTGTKSTNLWRERVGFIHNDLTNVGDTLSVDFITGNFDESNAVMASYERPIWGMGLRGRVYGAWSQYDASEVGVSMQNFTGEEWTLGAEMIGWVATERDWSADVMAGLRFKDTTTTNDSTEIEGEGEFVVPYIGMRLDQQGETSSFNTTIKLEAGHVSDFSTRTGSVDQNNGNGLGRLNLDDNWVALIGEASKSFYLEPLFDPKGFSTLAHEVLATGRAQWTLDSRLAPQEQMVAGGIYSVRGYPESLVAGDSVIMGSLEYRFHLPRALGVGEATKIMGSPFHVRPSRPFARPDWDLVFKAFIDAAHVVQNSRETYENNYDLLSAGVGVEWMIKQNVSLRVDYGMALKGVDLGEGGGGVDRGDSRLHVVLTFIY